MQIQDYIKNNRLKILVKPNSPKNEIKAWDKEKQALRVNIKAPPTQNKANKEIIKFFTKLLKQKMPLKIISILIGINNREVESFSDEIIKVASLWSDKEKLANSLKNI